MKCAATNERTFFRHQKKVLQPAILLVWLNQQCNLLSDIKKSGKSLQLGGDVRADSPGHTAKYGSYSMFDLSTVYRVIFTSVYFCDLVQKKISRI